MALHLVAFLDGVSLSSLQKSLNSLREAKQEPIPQLHVAHPSTSLQVTLRALQLVGRTVNAVLTTSTEMQIHGSSFMQHLRQEAPQAMLVLVGASGSITSVDGHLDTLADPKDITAVHLFLLKLQACQVISFTSPTSSPNTTMPRSAFQRLAGLPPFKSQESDTAQDPTANYLNSQMMLSTQPNLGAPPPLDSEAGSQTRTVISMPITETHAAPHSRVQSKTESFHPNVAHGSPRYGNGGSPYADGSPFQSNTNLAYGSGGPTHANGGTAPSDMPEVSNSSHNAAWVPMVPPQLQTSKSGKPLMPAYKTSQFSQAHASQAPSTHAGNAGIGTTLAYQNGHVSLPGQAAAKALSGGGTRPMALSIPEIVPADPIIDLDTARGLAAISASSPISNGHSRVSSVSSPWPTLESSPGAGHSSARSGPWPSTGNTSSMASLGLPAADMTATTNMLMQQLQQLQVLAQERRKTSTSSATVSETTGAAPASNGLPVAMSQLAHMPGINLVPMTNAADFPGVAGRVDVAPARTLRKENSLVSLSSKASHKSNGHALRNQSYSGVASGASGVLASQQLCPTPSVSSSEQRASAGSSTNVALKQAQQKFWQTALVPGLEGQQVHMPPVKMWSGGIQVPMAQSKASANVEGAAKWQAANAWLETVSPHPSLEELALLASPSLRRPSISPLRGRDNIDAGGYPASPGLARESSGLVENGVEEVDGLPRRSNSFVSAASSGRYRPRSRQVGAANGADSGSGASPNASPLRPVRDETDTSPVSTINSPYAGIPCSSALTGTVPVRSRLQRGSFQVEETHANAIPTGMNGMGAFAGDVLPELHSIRQQPKANSGPEGPSVSSGTGLGAQLWDAHGSIHPGAFGSVRPAPQDSSTRTSDASDMLRLSAAEAAPRLGIPSRVHLADMGAASTWRVAAVAAGARPNEALVLVNSKGADVQVSFQKATVMACVAEGAARRKAARQALSSHPIHIQVLDWA